MAASSQFGFRSLISSTASCSKLISPRNPRSNTRARPFQTASHDLAFARPSTRTYSTAESSPSCSTSGFNTILPPIRYHIFQNPLPYTIGLRLQNELVAKRIEWKRKKGGGRGTGILTILKYLEHVPTYTTGRRDNSPNPDTLHPEEKKVQHVGAEFHITKRGGQVTYHGPGQLVGYPLFDLNAMEMPTRCYVDYLQSLLADYVRSKGIEGVVAPHPEGHVGIFASPTEKVGSIGIHLQHRITSHGFAMNITPEPLAWFDLVLACGLADVKAVSLHDLMVRSAVNDGVLPNPTPGVKDVASELVQRFSEKFSRPLLDLRERSRNKGAKVYREMIGRAEDEAKQFNVEAGGWPSEPDLSRQRELGS
ncbi:hypothetical protein BD324DRAFT_578278 [Kockovaella imperatae]|uniref:lipoyl(octanoyl) transferase n=1 Tax=Kockovaella imperatae TaxID=4999 RepID=A0A1Y1ULB3_9TREE|nr:hypothetical protein BD324DRAFT_578278 [Kockovaella imperatae]ORX38294.1 hypothetical protein BD324DRAFT_578278 [Kockovaella imperatae]